MKYIPFFGALVSLVPLCRAEHKVSFPELESSELFETIMDDALFDGHRSLINEEEMMNFGTQHLHLCMEERAHEIELSIAIPKGIKPDDISITIDGNILTVRAQHKQMHETKHEHAKVKKESVSSFSIMRTLPVPVDDHGVTAVIENDILKITLPKKPVSTKSIKVIQK